MVGVAALRLNAADRHHRLASHADHVDPDVEGQRCGGGKAQLGGADHHDLVGEADLAEGPVHDAERSPERQCDVIGEYQRPCAGAALCPVHGHEVGSAAGLGHVLCQFGPERLLADGRLDAHRQTGRPGHLLHKVHQLGHAAECRMAAGAHQVFADGHAARFGDFGAHLCPGQQTADTGFRPLGQLHLDGAHRRPVDGFQQTVHRERAVRVPAPEVARPHLEHQVAAAAVVLRDTALAGVVHAAGQLRPAVERFDRRSRQRPEAHGRHVHDRRRPECLVPVPPGTHDLAAPQGRIGRHSAAERERAVAERDVAGLVDLVVGTEAEVGVLLLGGGIHPAPLVPVEGPFFLVVGDDVLAQLRSDLLQQEAEMPDEWEGAENGVALLEAVVNEHEHQKRSDDDQPPQPPRHAPEPTASPPGAVAAACCRRLRA